MKNAQAKIDNLLDLLVENLQDRIAEDSQLQSRVEHLAELERLIKLSNLNNQKQSVVAKQSPQTQTTNLSDEQLVADLMKTRDPDLFPRRGPRKGKRENAGKPLPPEPPFCAIHTGVICVPAEKVWVDDVQVDGAPVCVECLRETPPESFVSLKALL